MSDRSRPHRWPEGLPSEVLAWRCASCGETIREYPARTTTECPIDWRKEPK